MNKIIVLSASILALSLIGGVAPGARAGGSSEDEAFQKQVFGRPLATTNLYACFSRAYDAGHLAQHPRQNVRTMLLLVTGDANDATAPTYRLGLSVTFRKSGAHFESGGSCGSIHATDEAGTTPKTAHCGVDCDGGAIDVALRDANSVRVSIPVGARITRAGANDPEPVDESRRFGSDDKVFRLDKTALINCLRLANDDKEKAALRRGR
jgi:hypothetical protein